MCRRIRLTLRSGRVHVRGPLAFLLEHEDMNALLAKRKMAEEPVRLLGFDEDYQCLWQHAIVCHCVGGGLGFHRGHERAHVGDIH